MYFCIVCVTPLVKISSVLTRLACLNKVFTYLPTSRKVDQFSRGPLSFSNSGPKVESYFKYGGVDNILYCKCIARMFPSMQFYTFYQYGH